MTWRQEAAQIISEATKSLQSDATLAERKRAVDTACPSGWKFMSWPMKAWQAARRDYLVRYGYQPRTKKRAERSSTVIDDLPIFAAAKGGQ